MSQCHADRERALAVIERERAAAERAKTLAGGQNEAIHVQAAFMHDRVAAVHDQVAVLHDRVARMLRFDSDMSRATKQTEAKQRLLLALRAAVEGPIEAGTFEDALDSRPDILEPERLLVLVRDDD